MVNFAIFDRELAKRPISYYVDHYHQIIKIENFFFIFFNNDVIAFHYEIDELTLKGNLKN